jgi:hypothetical protein
MRKKTRRCFLIRVVFGELVQVACASLAIEIDRSGRPKCQRPFGDVGFADDGSMGFAVVDCILGGVFVGTSSWWFLVLGHMRILSISVMIQGKLFKTVSRSGNAT